MAVYAELSAAELETVAAAFGLPTPVEAFGIPAGSINSNFRLETPGGRYFLRLTTARSGEDLVFEANLLRLLTSSAFPAPTLLWTKDGAPYLALAGGRVSVFRYLSGEELTRAALTERHLEALGIEVGKLHRLAQAFTGDRANPYSPKVVRGWLQELASHPDPELSALAPELLSLLERSTRPHVGLIPRGVIHADIFLDNVKWLGDRVSAVFDFEMACREALALDVAITLNAWCFDAGTYQAELAAAFIRGYQEERPLTPAEKEHLFDHALFGAVRFTASRIRDYHLSPLPADRLTKKDFRTYLARARTLMELGPGGFHGMLQLG